MNETQQQAIQPKTKPAKETKIEKKLFLWLAVLVGIWLLYSIAAQNLLGPSTAQPKKETVTVSFKALAGDQIVLDKTVSVEKGANAFEEMRKIAEVKFTMYAIGPMIDSINGAGQQEGKYWILYVGGQMSEKGIGAVTLEKDSAIEWRLE